MTPSTDLDQPDIDILKYYGGILDPYQDVWRC